MTVWQSEIDRFTNYELDLVTYAKHFAIFPVKLKTGGFACCKSIYYCKVWGGVADPVWGRNDRPPVFVVSWFIDKEELLVEKLNNPTRYVGVDELDD